MLVASDHSESKAMHIRKDDQVVVITGDDKGPEHRKVLRVLPAKGKIVVEGVNRVYKHMKPSQRNQQGGRLSKEMPIDASNVLLFCPACNHGVRVGHRFTDHGQKQRFCKSCSTSLGNVGPVKPRRAVKK
jgi:large subunit ribosomal protein L24